MTQQGHNNPPSAVELYIEPYQAVMSESENWTDGTLVKNESEMEAVDALLSELRAAGGKKMDDARLAETKPLRDRVAEENAKWKVYSDSIDRLKKCLVAAVDPFKRDLAAKKQAEQRAAYEEAQRKEREAQEAERKANAASYEEQVAADLARQEALDAKKKAADANKDTVKGLRTVHHHEITSMSDLVNWIARHDKAAMAEFATEYARKHHRSTNMAGVRTWSEKEAY